MSRVVAFTYQADLWTPIAALRAVADRYSIPLTPDHLSDPVVGIAMLATELGIDHMNEYTYDSDRFPKVVWDDQLEPDDSIFDGRRHVLYESL